MFIRISLNSGRYIIKKTNDELDAKELVDYFESELVKASPLIRVSNDIIFKKYITDVRIDYKLAGGDKSPPPDEKEVDIE